MFAVVVDFNSVTNKQQKQFEPKKFEYWMVACNALNFLCCQIQGLSYLPAWGGEGGTPIKMDVAVGDLA